MQQTNKLNKAYQEEIAELVKQCNDTIILNLIHDLIIQLIEW